MKTRLLLLLVACFLVAMTSTAAAYEPTNGLALESNWVETKIETKEGVAIADIAIGEYVALSAGLMCSAIASMATGVPGFYNYLRFDPRRRMSRLPRDEPSGT